MWSTFNRFTGLLRSRLIGIAFKGLLDLLDLLHWIGRFGRRTCYGSGYLSKLDEHLLLLAVLTAFLKEGSRKSYRKVLTDKLAVKRHSEKKSQL